MAELTVERLFSDPPLFTGLPQNPQFTPDGAHVAYLKTAADDRQRLDLWRVNLASGEHSCWVSGAGLDPHSVDTTGTAAEQAERERRRQFARGITSYRFSPDGRYLLLPVAGTAYLLHLADDSVRAITPPGTRQTDMRFAPDGSRVSYVRDGNLYCCELGADREVQLTADGGDTVSNGLADFIAQEEMHRFEGYWWSPDCRYLAFTRVDESPIAVSQRFEINAAEVTTVPQRYPFAGGPNADVRLLVLEMAGGSIREIPYRQEDGDYLARVNWLGNRLAVQCQSRDQRTLSLHAVDPHTGDSERLLTETADTWVNLHDNLQPLPQPLPGPGPDTGTQFLWTSERSGHSQLYVYRSGELHPLTSGGGRINRVLWADGQRALVSGWLESATEQHLFEVTLAGDRQPRRLTAAPGWHEPTVSRDGRRVLDRYSALDTPARLDLLEVNDDPAAPARASVLIEERVNDDHPYRGYYDAHRTPQLGTLTAEDGQLLHYRLTRPGGPMPAGGCPVIVYVYGGPGVQRVRNDWPPLLLQLLQQHGYGVLELDNRGTGNRDPGFEAAIHRRLGGAEVRDQVAGAHFLAGLDWVDPQRIGVFGHSYGGYMTLMCLMQAGEHFKAGVAVAPVTDWHLYDTHYTERYLETPEANPAGYRDSNVLSHAAKLTGKLLLIHGMADDNVLFTHSTKLMRALQAGNQPFEMMAYPGSKHALQEPDVSIHRFNLLLDFFGRHL